MISPELEARFLRPTEIKEHHESTWNDKQHGWIRHDSTFALVTVVEEADNDTVILEHHDGSVIPIAWQFDIGS